MERHSSIGRAATILLQKSSNAPLLAPPCEPSGLPQTKPAGIGGQHLRQLLHEELLGIGFRKERAPDATGALQVPLFFLLRCGMAEKIFEDVKERLRGRDGRGGGGTIVGATIVAAGAEPKNKEGEARYGNAPSKEGQPVAFRHEGAPLELMLAAAIVQVVAMAAGLQTQKRRFMG